ncbi:43483_t:CDS:2, partial [Gigaspora margarita]
MSLYLIVIAAFLGFISYYIIYQLYFSPLCKIPGPPVTNLFLGHFASFLNEEPGESLDNVIKENGDIVRIHTFLCKPFLLITNLIFVQQILVKDVYDYEKPKMVVIRDVTGNSLPFADREEHKKQRKMMEPMFFVSNLKSMFPMIIKTSHQLKDVWLKIIGNKKEERIRISDFTFKLTLDMIGLIGFDLNFNSISSPSKLAQAYGTMSGSNLSPLYVGLIDVFPFIRKIPFGINVEYYNAIDTINNISEKIFVETKSNPGHKKTFISLLIQANENLPDNEKLSDQDLLNQVKTFIVAGHETTNALLTWAFYYLAKYSDVQERLRKEIDSFPNFKDPTFEEIESMKYLDAIYRETLRVVPPIPIIFRLPKKDIKLNKYFVPKGTPLMISTYAIHRNPLIWGNNAEDFDPSRWFNPEIRSKITKNAYLPFIIGPRTCIGMKLAQMQFKIIMFVLIKNLEFRMVKGFTFRKTTAIITKPLPGIDLMVSKVKRDITNKCTSIE